ncbi:acyl-CoA synthetase [Algoriphagus lacus]|uniref:Acyl-CoA synthetase n=1 Tax=Algoriphagus lacus TaxID=2056311 RepID=A0A418PR91_9BACT|nr:AMP-binding protein [Algoriphagus lacus]RIW15101.1 acyl-CoA synthetase [Algoriphagus lacus]
MFQLTFQNQSLSNLQDFELDLSGLPPFAQAAISFCMAWLSGQQEFSQFTSGSTGLPKKIELNRSQMIASAKATGAFFKTNSKTKLLCCLNPEYIAGKMMLVRSMVWNCPVVLVEPSADPLKGLKENFDFVAMVPLQVEKSLQVIDETNSLKSFENLIIGGAPISDSLKRNLVDQGIHAWQTYGMTETVSHIALAKIEEGPLEYQTLSGVEIGQDDRGTLWIKSPMSGLEKIQTNDLIELKSETSFFWLGRADFVVNSGGIKLFPELLEQKSEAFIQEVFPDCRYFFLGEKDPTLGEKLVLVLETKSPDQKKAEVLRNRLKSILEKFEVPKEIYFSKGFELTESGKIDRNQTFAKL